MPSRYCVDCIRRNDKPVQVPEEFENMNTHNRTGNSLVVFLSFLAMFAVSAVAHAQIDVLDAIDVSHSEDYSTITINLNVPVQYKSHVPQKSGDVLRIRVDPVLTTGDRRRHPVRQRVSPVESGQESAPVRGNLPEFRAIDCDDNFAVRGKSLNSRCLKARIQGVLWSG